MKFNWDSRLSCVTDQKPTVENPVNFSRVRLLKPRVLIVLVLVLVVVFASENDTVLIIKKLLSLIAVRD